MTIITIILAVWCCISPLFYYAIFKEEKSVAEIVKLPKKKKKLPEMTEEQKRMSLYAENIESYNGKGSAQKTIKRGK